MPRVLIIDDEPGIRFALKRWFERQGWSVVESGDGEDALTQLRGVSDSGVDRMHLVICDVNLPKRSGSSLVSLLRTERPETAARVILSTGDDVEQAAPGSVLRGFPHVLPKPFDLSALRTLVERVAQRDDA